MEFQEFSEKFVNTCKDINIELNDEKIKKFYSYMNLLLEWNEKINLTAITEPDAIILKHFVDSLTIEKFINKNAKIIDIGTGAGFPGIPVSIYRTDIEMILMDSLNKRIKFLDDVIYKNELNNVKTIHARAEELAKDVTYREKLDIATSRAVAPLNILLEYMLPFVKLGGYCICMKGSNIDEEITTSKKALNILNGKIEKIEKFQLPNSDIARNIVIIKKIGNTPMKYPRKAGTPAKEPLL